MQALMNMEGYNLNIELPGLCDDASMSKRLRKYLCKLVIIPTDSVTTGQKLDARSPTKTSY